MNLEQPTNRHCAYITEVETEITWSSVLPVMSRRLIFLSHVPDILLSTQNNEALIPKVILLRLNREESWLYMESLEWYTS